jgi:hypothetical protein
MSLAEFAGRDRLDLAARAALVATSVQSLGRDALEVVFSVGLMIDPTYGLRVMAMVSSKQVEQAEGPYFLPEVPRARAIVAAALGLPSPPDWIDEIRAMVMPPPLPQLGSGDTITSPAPGKIGCGASWTGGNGYLTAGHVALANNNPVMDGKTALGTVLFVSNPAGNMSPGADVGVVELPSGTNFSSTLTGTSAALPNDTVQVYSGGGPGGSGVIMSFATFLYLPTVAGTYGDTYSTTNACSNPGDSGSAVGLNGANIGIIVAGTTNYTSYIQDIRYLIAAARPSVSGLSV